MLIISNKINLSANIYAPFSTIVGRDYSAHCVQAEGNGKISGSATNYGASTSTGTLGN